METSRSPSSCNPYNHGFTTGRKFRSDKWQHFLENDLIGEVLFLVHPRLSNFQECSDMVSTKSVCNMRAREHLDRDSEFQTERPSNAEPFRRRLHMIYFRKCKADKKVHVRENLPDPTFMSRSTWLEFSQAAHCFTMYSTTSNAKASWKTELSRVIEPFTALKLCQNWLDR